MSDFLELLKNNPVILDPDEDNEEKIELAKAWRNHWKWRHPISPMPRPDGLVPPGGEFYTRTVYPTAEIAEQNADQQLYGFSGKAWAINIRPFLQYLGPRKVEG